MHEQAAHRSERSLGLRPGFFVQLVREKFGFFHPKSHSWLCHILSHALLFQDDLLKEQSWTLWRTVRSLFERASHLLLWTAASIGP